MANSPPTYISIGNPTNQSGQQQAVGRYAAKFRQNFDACALAVAALNNLFNTALTMVDNSVTPPIYALVETQFQLQAGQGATFIADLTAAQAALEAEGLQAFFTKYG